MWGYLACSGEMGNAYRILVENFKGRYHLGYPGIGESSILKWLLSKNNLRLWNRFIWLRTGVSGGLL
jgi:hypothetical protein